MLVAALRCPLLLLLCASVVGVKAPLLRLSYRGLAPPPLREGLKPRQVGSGPDLGTGIPRC